MTDDDPTLDLAETTLGFIDTHWAAQSDADRPLLKHRGDKRHYDSDERFRGAELRRDAVVGAKYTASDTEVVGTEADHDIESTVDMRVEATAGRNGSVERRSDFNALVRAVRRSILTERTYPLVDESYGVAYHDLIVVNESDVADGDNSRNYHRTDFDVVFRGRESLP